MIVAVHMPKCGGRSFQQMLYRQFRRRMSTDNDYPIHLDPKERIARVERDRKRIALKYKYLFQYRYTRCVHGHFMPYKYEALYGNGKNLFVTWLRDPLERLGSHYHYWQRAYDPETSKPLHRRMMEEEWTLEEFCFREEIRNLYQLYLWKFPLERFDFVGITEHYEEDVRFFFTRYLGMEMEDVPRKNVNTRRQDSYFSDPGLAEAVKEYHAEDFEMYHRAVAMRKHGIDRKTGRQGPSQSLQ